MSIQIDRVTVGPTKVASKGRIQEVILQLEIPEPERLDDQVHQDIDGAGRDLAELRLIDAVTGEIRTSVLGHLESVSLRTPESRPPYLLLQVRASLRHCRPYQLRRLAKQEVRLELGLLSQEMRQRVLSERESRYGEAQPPQVQ